MQQDRLKRLRKRRLLAAGAAGGLLLVLLALGYAIRAAARPQSAARDGGANTAAHETKGTDRESASRTDADRAAAGRMLRASAPDAMDAARRYLNQGEAGKAEPILLAMLDRSPRDQDALTLLAETMLAQSKPKDALALYLRAIAVGPDHAELRFAAATVAIEAGEPERAIEHYQAAERLDPASPKHPLYLAQVQRSLGKVDAAKASLLRAASLDPDLAIAWGVLADIALGENAVPLARQHIARARAADPANVHWRVIEARILRRDNQPAEAVRLLAALGDDALAEEVNATAELAMSYGLLGRADDAAGIWMRASAKRPEDAAAAYEAAQWLDRAGRRDEALIFADAAAALGHAPAKALASRLRSSE